ncbi:40S ribosomal protein S27-like [Tulasnella sp. UAMH 9824]|nr:40S ribosomal protein S27-like [Tulasnella sp. UAMH 9824]
MVLAVDLLNPSAAQTKRTHKLKRLVQEPNSYFMDVKCPGCFAITTVFSHAQTVVIIRIFDDTEDGRVSLYDTLDGVAVPNPWEGFGVFERTAIVETFDHE